MKKVLITGVSVIDFIFQIDAIPNNFEKYRANNASISGGGVAANAAVAIAKLNGKPSLVSRIGKDEIGLMIKNGLIKENVNLDNLIIFDGHKSSFSSVYINKNGDRQVMNYRDHTLPVDASIIASIKEHDAYLVDSRWKEGALQTLKLAKKNCAPGIVDAEETVTQEIIKEASHIAFSMNGLKVFTKIENKFEALKSIKNISSAWVCVTDGENGVYYLKDNKLENIPAKKITVKDTLGAGDVWHGAFALSLAEGNDEVNAIKFANSAATLKCKFFGGRDGFPNRQQVDQFLMEYK